MSKWARRVNKADHIRTKVHMCIFDETHFIIGVVIETEMLF